MSENGSNVSIEEIGPEEIEQIEVNDDAEVLIPDETGDKKPAPKPDEDDDPPLEDLVPVQPAPAPVPESTPAPVAQPAEPIAAPVEAAPVAAAPAAAVAAPVVQAGAAVEVIEEVPRAAPVNPAFRKPAEVKAEEDDGEEDDDDIDETLTERLIGLTEMFPECVRQGAVSLVKGSWSGTKYMYGFSRSAAWIFFSTASILFMPVMIETERLSIMDQQKQHKTQMLLGPGVASSGAPSLGPPPI